MAPRDRRAERTAATRHEILDAAWELVTTEGLAALTMRALGARVGMRAQSLYGYFASKHAIYDAMFGEANQELARRLSDGPPAGDPETLLRWRTRVLTEFSVEHPERYLLLFQRTIPGFEPSPESYAPAVALIEDGRVLLRECGVTDPHGLDAFTAVISGIVAQQNANEPGGRRWLRLTDQLIDMYLGFYRDKPTRGKR